MFVEFRLHSDHSVLALIDMPSMPMPNDQVRLDGTWYVMQSRGWVLTSSKISGAWVIIAPWSAT